MLERLSPFGDGHITGLAQAPQPKGAQPFDAAGPAEVSDFPATPPAEVLDALDRAARVVDELSRKDIALSFEHDAETSQVRVKVQHGSAATEQEISVHGLLNVLDGDTTEVSTGRR